MMEPFKQCDPGGLTQTTSVWKMWELRETTGGGCLSTPGGAGGAGWAEVGARGKNKEQEEQGGLK